MAVTCASAGTEATSAGAFEWAAAWTWTRRRPSGCRRRAITTRQRRHTDGGAWTHRIPLGLSAAWISPAHGQAYSGRHGFEQGADWRRPRRSPRKGWLRRALCAAHGKPRRWPRRAPDGRRRVDDPARSSRCRLMWRRPTVAPRWCSAPSNASAGIDILVNNVGKGSRRRRHRLDAGRGVAGGARSDAVSGDSHASRLVVPHMRRAGSGVIPMIACPSGAASPAAA